MKEGVREGAKEGRGERGKGGKEQRSWIRVGFH